MKKSSISQSSSGVSNILEIRENEVDHTNMIVSHALREGEIVIKCETKGIIENEAESAEDMIVVEDIDICVDEEIANLNDTSDGILEFLDDRWGVLLANYLKDEEIRSKLRLIQESTAAAAAALAAPSITVSADRNICPSSSFKSLNPLSLTINTDMNQSNEEMDIENINNNGENEMNVDEMDKNKNSSYYEYSSSYSPSNDMSSSLLFFSSNELEDVFQENTDVPLSCSPLDTSALLMPLTSSLLTSSLSPSPSTFRSLPHSTDVPSSASVSAALHSLTAPSLISFSAPLLSSLPSLPQLNSIDSAEMRLNIQSEATDLGHRQRQTEEIKYEEITNSVSNSSIQTGDNIQKDRNNLDSNVTDIKYFDRNDIIISGKEEKTFHNDFNTSNNLNFSLHLPSQIGSFNGNFNQKDNLSRYVPKGEIIFSSSYPVANGQNEKNIEINDFDSAFLNSGANSFFDISNGNSPKSRIENEESYRDVISSFLSDDTTSPCESQRNIINVNNNNVTNINDNDNNINDNNINDNNITNINDNDNDNINIVNTGNVDRKSVV